MSGKSASEVKLRECQASFSSSESKVSRSWLNKAPAQSKWIFFSPQGEGNLYSCNIAFVQLQYKHKHVKATAGIFVKWHEISIRVIRVFLLLHSDILCLCLETVFMLYSRLF